MLQSRLKMGYETHEVEFQDREQPEQEARFALALIERWGMVAGEPDGEDSAGRTKLRLLTPMEVVDRAFDTARLAMVEMRRRSLVHVAPDVFAADEAKGLVKDDKTSTTTGGAHA